MDVPVAKVHKCVNSMQKNSVEGHSEENILSWKGPQNSLRIYGYASVKSA